MSIYNGHNEDSSGNILLSIGNGMTATLESGTTASQAYTKGSYVFFDNKLCKVTQDITSGTTLEIGTNLAQTSIGTELTSHLRSNDGKEFYFDVKDGSYGFYPSASKVAEEFVPFGGTLSPGKCFSSGNDVSDIPTTASIRYRNFSIFANVEGFNTIHFSPIDAWTPKVTLYNDNSYYYNSSVNVSTKSISGYKYCLVNDFDGTTNHYIWFT